MANHFNDLLLQTLKQINVRLDRLDGRMDSLIETKTDKAGLDATNKKLDNLGESEKFDDLVCCLKRIDAELRTLTWLIGTEVAIIGVVLAFI